MKKNLLFLVLAFVTCIVGARAEELTVATGRTTTNEYAPLYGYYYDTGFKNTIVYPAEMLANMEGGTINSISFYANSDFTALSGGNVQVSIGEIQENELTGHLTGLTQVFSGVPGKDGVKCVFTFDTPYDYNGGNLAIELLLTSKGSNCPHIYFYGETPGRNTSWNSYGSTMTNGKNGMDFLPEATFNYDTATTQEYGAKVSTDKLEFGTVSVESNNTLKLTLRNTGTNAFTPTVTVTGNGFSTTYQAAELASKVTDTIPVIFNPSTVGDFTGTLSINCGEAGNFDVNLTGSALYQATVADGTATSSYLPVYGLWYDSPQKNQMIYPAELLANLIGKKLTSMTFYSSSTAFFSGGKVTFSLANIAEGTTYPSSGATPIDADLIEVYSAEPTVSQEWTINFNADADFVYDGGDLLIDVVTEAGSFKGMTFLGEAHDNASFYSYNNNNPTVQSFLPKVTFNYEDAGTVEPVYSMEVTSSKAIDCGSVVGSGSAVATEKLVVKNTGNQPVKPLITFSGDNAGMFTIDPFEAAELAPRKSAEYTITFTAPEGTEAGEYTANVAITDDNGNATAIEDVTVKGAVVAPAISGTVTPEALEFTIPAGKTTTGTITIANTGNTAFTPVFSALETPFSIDEATEIAAGESKEYTITYAPTVEGTNEATLNVTIGTQEPIAVTLNGTATEPTNEVVVCDETTSNMYVPFYGYWSDVYLVESQFIYPAEKLTGLNGRKITGIKFFATSSLQFNNGSIQLSIKETEQTTFESAAGDDMITDMTVAATISANNTTSELEFVFNEPIQYNGGNLAVEVRGLEKCTDVGYNKNYWYGENMESVTAYYHYNTSGDVIYFLPKAEFATIPGEQPVEEGITLAEMLETGVNDTEYTISDDLAVVEIANNADYAFLTDGENWIKVEFNEENEDAFYNDYIKGGTLKGTLKDIELNPYLVATATPEAGETAVDYEIVTVDLVDAFTLKVNQVAEILGYWNEADGALRAYAPANGAQGQSMTVNTAWAGDNITLVDGHLYQIRSAITLKEAWNDNTSGKGLKDYDYDFQNYIANALIAPSTPTGIENLNLSNVKSVRYYNVAGIESTTPFKGINIVVMEMNDGSKKTVKVVK